MDREQIQTFIAAAEDILAAVRSTLLIIAQTGDGSDAQLAQRPVDRLRELAEAAEGMNAVVELCREFEDSIDQFPTHGAVEPTAVYSSLDIVARIEAAVWDVPMHSEYFIGDVAGFVESSFDDLVPRAEEPIELVAEPEPEEFEIDEETLEIFRGEAEELLAIIAENLGVLSAIPDDQNALWEIRRSAHTFKGAAGIVGLKTASEVAHRMEDLMDTMVEMRSRADSAVIDFLLTGSRTLTAITLSREVDLTDLERKCTAAMASVSDVRPQPGDTTRASDSISAPAAAAPDQARAAATPIVRISLDRLDELIKLSRSLLVNRSALFERLSELELLYAWSGDDLGKLEPLLDAQRCLTDEIQEKLLQIRMVRFGTLETRLSRNIHVTCVDQGKKAVLEIENPDLEVDTQLIDAVIEPLIHLLKNAVVHGIELPETRRLLGKPERGAIRVKVESSDGMLLMSVSDDGAGVAVNKLREKAVKSGRFMQRQVDALNDRDAMQLMFDRGLTTADKIDLNAGRGVGMSIVKEAIESRGGWISVSTEFQRGTTFTVSLPLEPARAETVPAPEHPDVAAVATVPLVLIVDDSASMRRASVKLVEKAGCRAITANNGAEALELLLNGEWEPDLILSDVEMPQIDGWAFLEYVKTDENFGSIPVIMVTSLDSAEHRARARDLGAADYIVKPLVEDELTRVIDSLIKGAATELAVG